VDPPRPPAHGLTPPALAGVEPDAPSRIGRDGYLRLRFERRGDRTVVARSGFTLPLQVMAPVGLDDPACVVSVLNPTGGLLGGDRLSIDVEAGPDAHACLITPSATKVYRAPGDPAVQEVRLRLAAGAIVEWVPDHTILFESSAFRQSIDVDVGEGARLILADAFAAGRVARGEAWRFRRLESALRIRDAKGWLLIDRFVLAGDASWSGLGRTEGAPYFATVAIVGDLDVDALAATLLPGVATAPLPRRGALARCLAPDAPALIDAVRAVWNAARWALLGRAAPALRKG
jgi:urease accessory protein